MAQTNLYFRITHMLEAMMSPDDDDDDDDDDDRDLMFYVHFNII